MGVVDGSWNIIISYHVQEVCSKLLKRNRIICPEVAVNGQFLPGKSIFFKNCLKKSKFFGNLLGKIKIFLTRIHDPQISNQIDVAAKTCQVMTEEGKETGWRGLVEDCLVYNSENHDRVLWRDLQISQETTEKDRQRTTVEGGTELENVLQLRHLFNRVDWE